MQNGSPAKVKSSPGRRRAAGPHTSDACEQAETAFQVSICASGR
jgi:hypothetical protein